MDKNSSFPITRFRANFSQLEKEQKQTIILYSLVLITLLVILIASLGYKLHKAKQFQDEYIDDRIGNYSYTESEVQMKLKGEKEVNTQVFFWNMNDINMKEKYLNLNLYIGLTYNESDFKAGDPELAIYNGRLLSQKVMTREVDDRHIVHELLWINTDIEPIYMVQMYPLDKELLSVRIAPKNQESNYYFKVTALYDYTEGAQSNYDLIDMGFNNVIQEPQDLHVTNAPKLTNKYKNNLSYMQHKPFLGMNRSYMLFEHKSIYSYIKSIQYILLSISVAIISILINSKTNSPKNGRVAVIGSSVFALVANLFQLNATNRPTNLITVIDLMTFFCGLIIILCFLITLRTLRFLDDEGYPVAKLFDQAMFMCIFTSAVMFFVAIYIYA
jgi:hypothetical protein